MSGLDPEIERMLARMPQVSRAGMSPAEARRDSRQRTRSRQQAVESVARVFDRVVPTTRGDVGIRVYAPTGSSLPALIYLHGGGWVTGDLDGPDPLCRTIANHAGCVVVSVDYPLAPEHACPAGLEASYDVTRWVHENGASIGVRSERLAVGGESAGANLAAGVAILARDRSGPPLVLQLLLMPALDHACDTASYVENAVGYGLTREEMQWWWRQYLGVDAGGRAALASPLRAIDLSAVAPAHIVTAEFDPLRDEGDAYAARLAAAGVPVSHRQYRGAIHGFLSMAGEVFIARRALDDIGRVVRGALAPDAVVSGAH